MTGMLTACPPCQDALTGAPLRVPRHLVQPLTGEPQLYDTHCGAVCPACGTTWRRWRNKYEVVERV